MKRKTQTSIVYQRAKLEARIAELGGTVPSPWPWADVDPVIRNLQLLEYVEALESNKRLLDMTLPNQLLRTNRGHQ